MKTNDVEKLLGITRQALINYEKEGLIYQFKEVINHKMNIIKKLLQSQCKWIYKKYFDFASKNLTRIIDDRLINTCLQIINKITEKNCNE